MRNYALTSPELRVLGCLLEKQRTTPDAYPLSLNALRLAANQTTNRDPVVDYDDGAIRDALHRLERRGLVRLASGAGSRAVKYRHLLAEALPMDAGEQALMCVLMLRGAQTPGELKQRGERIHAFADLTAVHDTLARLIARELVQRLPRRPGHKEERYAQLLSAAADEAAPAPVAPPQQQQQNARAPLTEGQRPAAEPAPDRELYERLARLEREVAELRAAVRDHSLQTQ
jgi:uncharacterized protein